MWIYLLKFSACLAVLLLFYKLVLEQVHMHHFKRYFLVSAFVISLGIPLITFTQHVTVTLEPTFIPTYLDQTSSYPQYNVDSATNILPSILWSIYALGATIFSLQFFLNLRSMIKNIRNNPKRRSERIHHVLLQELIAPHTFFSYIFFNKKDYEDRKIPQEVFWHEETHAEQKHSLDILMLELLQIVFWFHPLVYWAKHLVKLNHEFLADQAVLNKGASVPNYQKMVLLFSSSDSYRNAVTPSLANAIHYSSIKKRIVIMKTQTSKKAIWLKSLLLLPLITLLFYGFSTKEILEIQKIETDPIGQETIYDSKFQNITMDEIVIAINKYGQLLVNVDLVKIDDLKSHLFKYNEGLTKEQKSKIARAIIRIEKETPDHIIKKVEAILIDYGVTTIDIKPRIKQQASITEIKKFNTLAKKYNAQSQETRAIPLKDLKTLETIYSRMTASQKSEAQPFPDGPPPPTAPAPASVPNTAPIMDKRKPASPPPPAAPQIEMKNKPYVGYGNLYILPQQPPEPHPNPVEYIKELAKKGASFYIGPHKYAKEEAVELVRKSNGKTTIDVSQYPEVRLGGC